MPLSTAVPNLVDVAKRLDPDGKVADMAEMLEQSNPILMDIPWYEGNLPTGHRNTVRTSLPSVSWRLLNQAVSVSKSTSAQFDEGAAMLEAWSEVDEDLANLNGNSFAFRLSEAAAFIEAMGQEMASKVFYGGANPEEMYGLSRRYSATTNANGTNILLGGSSDTDNSSVWLIGWGKSSVFGIYPKGSKAGLDHIDHGKQVIQGATGVGASRMVSLVDQYKWKCGLSVKDWRFAVRIANIDISNLVAKSSAADLRELMIKAIHRLPAVARTSSNYKLAFYCNRTVMEYLDIQAKDSVAAGGGLTYENVDGKSISSFRGIPVRVVDALTEAESAVA